MNRVAELGGEAYIESGMREEVQRIVHAYRFNPPALAKAVDAFVTTELKKRQKADEQAVALKVCRHYHPAGTGQAYCKGCHDAEIAKLTGQDREIAETDL